MKSGSLSFGVHNLLLRIEASYDSAKFREVLQLDPKDRLQMLAGDKKKYKDMSCLYVLLV